MNPIRVLMASALAALLLSGCVSRPVRTPEVPVDPVQAQAQDRERAVIAQWGLSGRIAVSNGKQGGSGRIDWQQADDRYTVALSAPITRQSWRLSGDAAGARLEGIEGGPRASPDVEAMLLETTGWNIPVRALADWVRGVGAPEADFGAARIAYGDGNRPVRLEQAGWTIDYSQWQADAAPSMPLRLVATRGDAKVRLIVDEWAVGQAP